MGIFLKTVGGILIAVVLSLALGKQEKDLALLLSMAVCCMTVGAAVGFLRPVFDFLYRLKLVGDLENGGLEVLMKIVGIGLVAEIAAMICADGGSAGLGKGVQILGSAVILYLSLPVFESLLELIAFLLGGI